MPSRIWRTTYKEHTIEIENWWGIGLIFNRHRCQLFIDGKRVDEVAGKGLFTAGEGSFRSVLRGQIDVNEAKPVVIRAEIWTGWVRLKCRILADDSCILEDA